MLVEQFIDEIVLLITSNLLAGLSLAPVALAITQLAKFLPPLKDVPARTINAVVVIGVFVIAVLSERFGYLEQFNQWYEVLSGIILAIATSLGGSAGLYKGLNALDAPLLGVSRNA